MTDERPERRPIPFEQPLFERVDGEALFDRLVTRFYAGVTIALTRRAARPAKNCAARSNQ